MKPERIASIDFLRVVAVFAVICIHTEPLKNIWPADWNIINQAAGFAVPYFFIVSGFLYTRNYLTSSEPLAALYRRRIKRLLLVLLTWSSVYFLIPDPDQVVARGIWGSLPGSLAAHVHELSTHPVEIAIQGGINVVLWFLVALMIGLSILTLFLRSWRPGAVFVLAVPMYLFILASGFYSHTPLGLDVDIDFNSTPGSFLAAITGPFIALLFVSIGMALARMQRPPSRRLALAVLAFGITAQLTESYLASRYMHPFLLRRELLGTVPFALGVMLLALSMPNLGKGFQLAGWGQLALGVYAGHSLVIDAVQVVTGKARFGTANPEWQLVLPLIVFSLTLTMTAFLSKSRLLRKVVT